MDPRDTAPAFATIASEVERLLSRLGHATKAAEIMLMRDEIANALAGVGLTWSDLTARVTAPPPALAGSPKPVYRPPPPPMPSPWPVSEEPVRPPLDPSTVLSDEQLQAYGYRRHP